MLRAREAVAHRERRDHHVADAEMLEAPCRADNINNRIDRADFVKVNAVGRRVVNLRLGLREHFENRDRAIPDSRGELRCVNKLSNLTEMTLRLWLRHLDIEFERRNAAQNFAPRREPVACDRHRPDRAFELAKLRPAVEDCADNHIAAQP